MIAFHHLRILILSLMVCSFVADLSTVHAQALRSRLPLKDAKPKKKTPDSPWSASLVYSVNSDYADTRTPRGYNNYLEASGKYKFDDKWSVDLEAALQASTVEGQVNKGQEEGYPESVNPSTTVSLSRQAFLVGKSTYALGTSLTPLWDEPSRREGYEAQYGVSAKVSVPIVTDIYSMTHSLSYSEFKSSYKYSTKNSINQANQSTYSFGNSLRIGNLFNLGYSFGLRLTQFLDATSTYSYKNSASISRQFGSLGLALSYENGGFTDKGDVSLWYVDQYRRMLRLSVSYVF